MRKICTYFTVEAGRGSLNRRKRTARGGETRERATERVSRCVPGFLLHFPIRLTLYFRCLSKASRKGTVANNRDQRRYSLCALKQVAATAQLECISAVCICMFSFFCLTGKKEEKIRKLIPFPQLTGCSFNCNFVFLLNNNFFRWDAVLFFFRNNYLQFLRCLLASN